MIALLLRFTPPASAQWTVTYIVDQAQATAALGAPRVDPMLKALDRAKAKLEQILLDSTGSMTVTVDWSPPANPNAAAAANVSQFHGASAAVARDKLINQASADNEPAGEILMYESLPQTTVPFFYGAETMPLSTGVVAIPNSLNKHLGFQPVTNQNDGTIQFRPPGTPTPQWQFWSKRGQQLPNHEIFEAVVIHETIHLLGFLSAGDSPATPASLLSWDLLRFGDASIPVNANTFTTLPRELRPNMLASGITALNSSSNAYKLSSGTRTGGDGFQTSHWRAYTLLNPQSAIGIMDPSASGAVHQNLNSRFFTRPDVEALDVMGWNVDPGSITYANAGAIQLIAPAALAQIPAGADITFVWGETSFIDLDVYIISGTEIYDDNPIRVFYQLPGGTTSATLTAAEGLPPGEYIWSVVGRTQVGNQESEERRFTITSGISCDALDLSNNNIVDADDIFAFLGIWNAGPPGAACITPPTGCPGDWNNSGIIDADDIFAYLADWFAFGPGTPCP